MTLGTLSIAPLFIYTSRHHIDVIDPAMQSLQSSIQLSTAVVPTQMIKPLIIVDPGAASSLSLVQLNIAEVVILDRNRNGVEQITEVLSHFAVVNSLQIITRTDPGALQLGSCQLNYGSLESHCREIHAWQQFLTPAAQILLNQSVAIGIEGMAFIGRFSQITGALVVLCTGVVP